MELTFVNKKKFTPKKDSITIFPTEVDYPCDKNRKDINLHFWPFYSGTIQHISQIITQLGWEKWGEIIKLLFDRIVTKWESLVIRAKLRRPTSFS